MNPRARSIALCLLAASLSGTTLLGQAVFSDSAGRFTLSVPAGWVQVPDSILRQRTGPHSLFVAAFQTARARVWFEHPYALIQVQVEGPVDPESLAAALTNYRPEGPAAVSPPSFEARFDSARGFVRWGGAGQLADGRTTRWYSGYRTTEFGAVGVLVYGLSPDSVATAAQRDSLTSTLGIAPSQRYRTAQAGGASRVQGLELVGALAFLALAGALLGVLWLFSRQGSASQNAHTGRGAA